ncbi:deoxynucleoside kinase [Vibrio panuliri]|uniref:Deoxynucleoside kinase domain-containing protein n=1 Tax=Vibrio panuliri TaxID=1381081 RepID=A0ABX3FFS0_9VIBR|nr:deoxynucleoside kinase [Vibrio panuliri]KAB1460885.1 AAA family ATPase [Vibrio panuliri]OLQ91638.1 hypothetical protein BIY20_09555 [Vibrio panuliri]
MIIALEGNIASGKSTLLPLVAKELGYEYIEEGIENDAKFKELVAKNKQEELSVYAAEYRMNYLKKLDASKNYLVERTPLSSYLFAMADDISEESRNKIFNAMINAPAPELHVYIRSLPHLCKKRINKRKRAGEDKITMKRLRKIHNAHEEWAKIGEDVHKVFTLASDNEMSPYDIAKCINKYMYLRKRGELN